MCVCVCGVCVRVRARVCGVCVFMCVVCVCVCGVCVCVVCVCVKHFGMTNIKTNSTRVLRAAVGAHVGKRP